MSTATSKARRAQDRTGSLQNSPRPPVPIGTGCMKIPPAPDSTHDGVHSRHRRIGLAAMEWISSRSSSAPEGPEPVESSRQIIEQILACLKTRMDADPAEIGRASIRERVCQYV